MTKARRWTQEELDDVLSKRARAAAPVSIAPKRAKYGQTRTTVDGITFDSKLEARYYAQLMMEWRSVRARHLTHGYKWNAGDLLNFMRQQPFELEGGVKYVADFAVVRFVSPKSNSIEFVDTKGELNQQSKNKIKQVRDRYGIEITLLRDNDVMKVSV